MRGSATSVDTRETNELEVEEPQNKNRKVSASKNVSGLVTGVSSLYIDENPKLLGKISSGINI
jgi:hypothetical protein